MTILSRFVDEDAIHQRVAGCPLASEPPSTDESACASCRFNVVRPNMPRIGCALLTPHDVFERAVASMSAPLRAELAALRANRETSAQAWLQFVERWLREPSTHNDASRELASVITRFATASARFEEPVTILGAR